MVLSHTTGLSGITGAVTAVCVLGRTALSATAQRMGNLHFTTVVQYNIYMPAWSHLH